MKDDNVIVDKTFKFGLRILKLYMHLRDSKLDRGLCSQLLRSGTSIGANIEEAMGGSSRKDFIYKLEVAYRETRETMYWLQLLKEAEIIEIKLAELFILDCNEIRKILSAIINFSKSNS